MDTYLMTKLADYNHAELARARRGRDWTAIFRKAR
jgi:hypothetical protein